LISEGKLGTLSMASLCDTPGERAVVGDTQDQAALAAQETRGFQHDLPRCAADRESPYDTGQRTLQAAAICLHFRTIQPREYGCGQSVCPGDMVHLQGAANTISRLLVDRANRRCTAASWEGECVGRIPSRHREFDSSIATVCAGAHPQRRACRRP